MIFRWGSAWVAVAGWNSQCEITHCEAMYPIVSRLAGAGLLGVRGSAGEGRVRCGGTSVHLTTRPVSKPLPNAGDTSARIEPRLKHCRVIDGNTTIILSPGEERGGIRLPLNQTRPPDDVSWLLVLVSAVTSTRRRDSGALVALFLLRKPGACSCIVVEPEAVM